MKGQSVQKIHLDIKEIVKTMLLHKQQSTDGQLLYSMVSSRLKTSTVLFWSTSDVCTEEMFNLSRTRY